MKDTNQLTEGLSVLWHALHCYREDSIQRGLKSRGTRSGMKICTAMAPYS